MIQKHLEKTPTRPKPVVLFIMDGWGDAPHSEHNAITSANTPVFDDLRKHYPNGLINASESHVGLPEGQMGNSETGHANIGGGRIMLTDFARIENSIANKELEKKEALQKFIKKTKADTGVVHLLGLISDGGVHSHQKHTTELANIFAKNGLKVKLHLFTDGRDVPPQSALGYIDTLEKEIKNTPDISIATIGGRYYGMDRDTKWDRTQIAYDSMVSAKGKTAANAKAAIENSYSAGETDEFVMPTVIGDYKGMENGDSLFISNFRTDRVKQIATALLSSEFDDFTRNKKIDFSTQLSMTKFSDFMPELFSPEKHKNVLGEILEANSLKQLRIAESEKEPHVTYFFNGGRDKPFIGEDRIKIPSPDVPSYDQKPEMSAHEVTKRLLAAINEPDKDKQYDFIVVNYANTDMVGHTANKEATIKAAETVDKCLGKIKQAVLAKGGAMIVTADHGNADKLVDEITGEPHTAHTTNLVPAIMVSKNLRDQNTAIPKEKGLCDLAPTILQFMNIEKPIEMTGNSLLSGRNINLLDSQKTVNAL